MRKYFAEGLGTFGLIFCGTGAMVINEVTHGAVSHVGVAITWGLIVIAMIYAVGHVCGAHLNPAVTIGFHLSGRLERREILPYFLAQLVGAFLASGLLRVLFPDANGLGETLPHGSAMQSFIIEIILTFFLMFVILQVTTEASNTGNVAGIVIGLVVLLEAMFAGPITGASMNPTRSLTPAIVSGHLQHLWVYISAPFIGSILAVISHRIIETD